MNPEKTISEELTNTPPTPEASDTLHRKTTGKVRIALSTLLLWGAASLSTLNSGCVYRPRGDNSWDLRGNRVWVGAPGSIPEESDEDVEMCIGSSLRLFFSGPYYLLDSLEKTKFIRMLYIWLPGAPNATFAYDDSNEVKKELFLNYAKEHAKSE